MSTQAGLGQKALKDRNYDDAVKHLTQALKSSQSPLWLIQRSTAYQRLGKYELALADADNAVLVAIYRARREHIATAHFRRAVALYGLKRYGDARMCLIWCRKNNEKEPGLGIWQAKVAADYEKLGDDAEENIVTVKEIPDKVEEVGQDDAVESKEAKEPSSVSDSGPTPSVAPASSNTLPEKVRHEWFQSKEKITISIFAKGVPKEETEVTIEEGTLEVRFPLASGSSYDFTISPLYAKIVPGESTYSVRPQKIEITLHKSTAGLKWASLEGTEVIPTSTSVSEISQSTTIPEPVTTAAKAPAYPTSSRTGPKDWDAVATSALRKEKPTPEDGKWSNDADDDDYDGDPMEGFFKKLYKDADPDTKRAMMKSYQESNGTALSTNWADVKKAPVETHPPDGLEAKKWAT